MRFLLWLFGFVTITIHLSLAWACGGCSEEGAELQSPKKLRRKMEKDVEKYSDLFSHQSVKLFSCFTFPKPSFFFFELISIPIILLCGLATNCAFCRRDQKPSTRERVVIENLFWCFNQLRWRLCGNFTLILCETERKLNDLNCARLIKSRSDAFLRCSMGSWIFPICIIHMFRGFDWSREL